MGEVYRAHDLKLDQVVALKFLPAQLSQNPDRLERLLNEVRIARQVSHPNVCRVWDIGEADGRHFLTMEWIAGEDLAGLLRRRGRLDTEEASRLARQLCAGVAAAHEQGIVHRDLKPSNIMIDERGVLRITDFGLAEAASATRGDRAREGTPAYMAPEQATGGQVTKASDIYALGLVLCELMTGRHPLETAVTETLPIAELVPPPAFSRLAPGLDSEVEKMILACLAVDPEQRPPSARVVAEAFGSDESLARAQAEAQARADRIEAFRAELAELRAAGVVRLDDDQLVAVEKHHRAVLADLFSRLDVDSSERGKQLSLGMRIASVVGASALAASFFYFFFSIWGTISLSMQVAILVSTTIVTLLATDMIARRERGGHFATIAALLAIACLITNTTALGSVLNTSSLAISFALWGGFALLIAYGYALRLPLAIGLVFVTIFLAGELHVLAGGFWAYCASKPESFMAVGLALLLISLWRPSSPHPGFAPIYRLIGLTALVLPSVFLGQNVLASYLPISRSAVTVVHQLFGCVASVVVIWLGIRARQRDVAYAGAALLILQLFLRAAYWWWDWMPRYVFFLIIALAAIGILVLLRRLRTTLAALNQGGQP